MKKILLPFFTLFALLLFFALCTTTNTKNDKAEIKKPATKDISDSSKINTEQPDQQLKSAVTKNKKTEKDKVDLDCEEFLEEYKKFMDEYVIVIERFKKKPANPQIHAEFRKLTEQAKKWKPDSACFSNPEFVKQFENTGKRAVKVITQ